MKRNLSFITLGLLGIFLTQCIGKPEGPFFGNGFRNGWADQTSVVIWTRLTKTSEMNREGAKFLVPSADEARELAESADKEKIDKAQIPEGVTLEEMEGACPGAAGEVKLVYFPLREPEKKVETEWVAVEPEKNFTRQWKLENLTPGTKYVVELYARKDRDSKVSDDIKGAFLTPPSADVPYDPEFVIITCHDYPRRDDSIGGHKIYPVMLGMFPDFYVHTGDVEYYDKPGPYALTEELMRFKWDRLFALPFQRTFFTQVTTYFMKDDHDALTNDAYPGMTYGTVSFERGLEIFDQEQFPANDKPYKTVRWGKDLQIWMIEGRNYRSPNNMEDGPDKTILGTTQKEWLFKTLKESDASFKVLISPGPILGPDRKTKKDNHANAVFQHEGDEIRSFLNQFDNLYICNGDRHWQYVTHPEGTNLWEFGCGPGSDSHAEGWPPHDKRPEHRFLRVKGGFLKGSISREEGGAPRLTFRHYDVDGNVVHEETFRK
ncbi:MAG: alkaline phosphatase D family protein [Mangrovibacterium sp.]